MIQNKHSGVGSQKSEEKGFTLIETIITLIVLSIAAVGVLSVFTTGMKGSANPLILNQAVSLAQERMDTIIGDRMNPARGYTWITTAVSPYLPETPVTGFPAFNRSVTICCVSDVNLNYTPPCALFPPCASGYAHITVTVSNTTVGDIDLDTVVTNY
ncbi:MAG: type II secretion system GspH family protein [Nitrospirae bacterium]|nr:type II secretion system GspH family protein [Nitrospirota bacterium]